MAKKIYNMLKRIGRRNYYDPQEKEESYDPSAVFNDKSNLFDVVRHKMFKLGNTRKMEKRKLRRKPDENVEMKGMRALRTADEKVLFMGILDESDELVEKLGGVD